MHQAANPEHQLRGEEPERRCCNDGHRQGEDQKRRHPLILLGICTALLAATMLGSERAMTALASALIAAIVLSLFELYKLPTR